MILEKNRNRKSVSWPSFCMQFPRRLWNQETCATLRLTPGKKTEKWTLFSWHFTHVLAFLHFSMLPKKKKIKKKCIILHRKIGSSECFKPQFMWCPPMGPICLPTAPKFLGRFPKIAILCEAIRPRNCERFFAAKLDAIGTIPSPG